MKDIMKTKEYETARKEIDKMPNTYGNNFGAFYSKAMDIILKNVDDADPNRSTWVNEKNDITGVKEWRCAKCFFVPKVDLEELSKYAHCPSCGREMKRKYVYDRLRKEEEE